jgi:hypothetical protein
MPKMASQLLNYSTSRLIAFSMPLPLRQSPLSHGKLTPLLLPGPRARASRSRCLIHRKRESRHDVNGCSALPSPLHYLACRTTAD